MDKQGYGTIHLEHSNGSEAYISQFVFVDKDENNEWLWEGYTDSTARKEGVNAFYNEFTKTLRDNGYKVQKNRPQYNLNKFYAKGGLVKKSDFTMLGVGALVGGIIAFVKK